MRGFAHVWQATSVAAAARLMASTRMKELVVLDDHGGPVGIISVQDLVARRTLGDADSDPSIQPDARVAEVMAASVAVVDQDVPVATAAARMLYTKRDQLVVVDERGVAVGCISMNDVLRWLVFPSPAPAPAKT